MASDDGQKPPEGAEAARGAGAGDFEKLEARVEKLEARSGCLWVFAWVVVALFVFSFFARIITS